MMDHDTDTLLRKSALVAGVCLFVMTVFAIFGGFFVFRRLIVPANAATTTTNILANEILFRAGIGSYLIVIICDIVSAWALYIFLKPVNEHISLLAALFRWVYATCFGVALSSYLDVSELLVNKNFLSALAPNQSNIQVMLSIQSFENTWGIGFVFFSFHLMLLGYLVFRLGSKRTLRILGVLLAVAGLGYLVDHVSKILYPSFATNISIITGWGELLFMFWLLFRGGKRSDRSGEAIG